jgi:hypothetical protein
MRASALGTPTSVRTARRRDSAMSEAQNPRASQGEDPRDEQSETVGGPYRDDDPPRRDARAPIGMAVLIAFLAILGIALVVLAITTLV